MKFKIFSLFVLAFSLTLISGCKPSSEALLAAVKADNTAEALKLIDKGGDANSRTAPGGWSALHYAARNGNVEIVQALLKAGADANYAGTLDGQANSAKAVKPLPLAQGVQEVAMQVEPDQIESTLRQNGLNDPALLKSAKDPDAPNRYQKVILLLAKVTK